MERELLVSVFETDNFSEIQQLQQTFSSENVECVVEQSEDMFSSDTVFKLKVHLFDEQKAFEIIDLWLRNSTQNK